MKLMKPVYRARVIAGFSMSHTRNITPNHGGFPERELAEAWVEKIRAETPDFIEGTVDEVRQVRFFGPLQKAEAASVPARGWGESSSG